MSQDADYYEVLAAQRYAALEAAENQIRVNLQYNYANGGDTVEDSESIQQLANIRAEKANLAQLAQEHAQSKVPHYAPPLTNEEKQAKPLEKMTWQDSWEIASKSKHGVDPDAFRAGMAEVMARRNRGK